MASDLDYPVRPAGSPYPRGREGLWLLIASCGLSCIVATLVVEAIGQPTRCRVSGRLVLDEQPVDQAVVAVAGRPGLEATSNAMGEFSLNSVPVGCITLTVKRGNLSCGYPLKLPPRERLQTGDLPLYRWRSVSGDPERGATVKRKRGIIVVR